MSDSPKVWIVGGQEIDHVRGLLAQANVAFGDGATTAATRVQLLVTSARSTLLERDKLPVASTHLVVYEEASRVLRKVLERSGCDLVMRMPLNAHSFRLLLNFALYAGPEKRRSRRVVLSEPVKISFERRVHPATLVSLSLRGCGLVTEGKARVGSELRLRLPAELTGNGRLDVTSHVLSVRADGDTSEVSLAFRLMDVEARRTLNALIDRHASSAELRPRTGRAARGPAHPRPGGVRDDERRDGPRKSFTRRVLAAGAGISHVLIGRDLSAGGMRVRPDPDLGVGDVLRLAVHGRPGQPAIMLKAVVDRDEGDDGIVLRFQDVPATIAQRLEEIVAELPALPPGKRGVVDETPATIVSEVLDRS